MTRHGNVHQRGPREELWDDQLLISVARMVGVNAPDLTAYRGGIFLPEFTASQLKELHGCVESHHSCVENTDFVPHLHYATNSTSAVGGGIRWGLEYTLCNATNGSVESAPQTTYITDQIPASNGQFLKRTVDFPSISGAGLSVSFDIAFRVFRDGADAADTFPASVWLRGWSLHLRRDGYGSWLEKQK